MEGGACRPRSDRELGADRRDRRRVEHEADLSRGVEPRVSQIRDERDHHS